MLIFNFKAYSELIGRDGIEAIEQVSQKINTTEKYNDVVFFAPEVSQLGIFVQKFQSHNFVAQNVDVASSGSHTGWVAAENLLNQGVNYSLLNHSEHRVSDLLGQLRMLQTEAPDLHLIVCCETVEEADSLSSFTNIAAIAYEPKELIGSGKSVTEYKPQEVQAFIEVMKKSPQKAIIGAGISSGEDITAALEMGAEGVLVASAFAKAQDKITKLEELVTPFLGKKNYK